MWVLPGYGDHLEELSPGLRKGMEEMSAPRGFEDVVAGINLISADQPDRPAHWGLTFAVDDADAIAAKATELGGTVLMPPFDGLGAMAVIADPQGATFWQAIRTREPRPGEAGEHRKRGLAFLRLDSPLHSAAINPGNSGGALVDVAGRVIGIPTLAALDPQMGGANRRPESASRSPAPRFAACQPPDRGRVKRRV